MVSALVQRGQEMGRRRKVLLRGPLCIRGNVQGCFVHFVHGILRQDLSVHIYITLPPSHDET